MKATLGQLKAQFDTSTLGIQTCSDAFVSLVNEATQRLIMGPEQWWDVIGKASITAFNGCITWPRQIASILSVAICGVPIPIRNQWFEFLESGYGLRCCNTCDCQLFDRGTAVTFRDIRAGYTVKLTSTANEASSLEFGILGYDINGNWIRTQDVSLNWRDGYWLAVPTTAGSTTNGTRQFSLGAITQIIKPLTNGALQLADLNLSDSTDTQLIGVYDYNETTPSYRRSFIGGLPQNTTSQVDVMYKAEFMPVANDTDLLLIGNIPALKEQMMAVKLYNQNQFQLASGHEAKAVQLLDREVEHYIGGSIIPLRIDYKSFGAGGIPVLF